MNTDSRWKDYYAAQTNTPARPRLVQTLDLYDADWAGHALDLGCGRGADAAELIRRGWSVEAIDSDPDAIELTQAAAACNPGQLNAVLTTFECLTLARNQYDLVNASYSLPFCKPSFFVAFWENILQALKPGGRISCELFGVNDTWNKRGSHGDQMTFLTRVQVEELCRSLQIEELKEEEYDGTSFSGPKHWHLFMILAKKPS